MYDGNGKPPADCPATLMTVQLPECRVIHDHEKGRECVNAGDGWRAVRTLIHVCNDHDDDNEKHPHGFKPPTDYTRHGPIRWNPESYGAKENLVGNPCSRCKGTGEFTTSWATGRKDICTRCEGSGKVAESV